MEFVPILDSTARLASLRSGDLHMIERASPTDLPEIRGDSRLKVSGVPVFSAGDFEAGSGTESIVLRDEGARSYRKLVLRDGCLAGAVLVGDTTDALWYVDLMRSGAAVAGMRDALVFGRAYTEAA